MIKLKQILNEAIEEKKVAAGVFLIAKNTKTVLLGLRSPKTNDPNVWGLPGGGSEPNENNPKDTAKREFEEETGHYIYDVPLVRGYVDRHDDITYYNFIGVVQSEFDAIPDKETSRFKWFTIDEIEKIPNLHWGVERLLSDKKSKDIIQRIIE